MKLIVGLGNPGREYHKTRHNAGFMVLEALADRHGLTGSKGKFHASVLDGQIAGERVLLMQPTTYMNRSGLAVGEATRFHRIEPSDVMIVVDETALPLGTIRIRPGGSAGGHNGLADIERALGTEAYPRLRVGVGEPMVGERRIAKKDYVLGRFTDDELAVVGQTAAKACDAIEAWLTTEDIRDVMSRYNARNGDESTEHKTD